MRSAKSATPLLGTLRTPYIGNRGWVSVWVDQPVKWSLVSDLVRRSYRLVAPRRAGTNLAGSTAPNRRKRRHRGVR